MKRKVTVPGSPLEAKQILQDIAKNSVVAIPHAGKVVLVFHGSDKAATAAWEMTQDQVQQFIKEVRLAHRAMSDDEKIAQLEKEFGSGTGE